MSIRNRVEEVFVTEGVPAHTFVRPPNFADILLDLRRQGKPVIIEGQSGTGKTTCVRKVLEQLESGVTASYLTARNGADVSKIEAIARDRPKGIFVIDDFHRLDSRLQTTLADIAKVAAERASDDDALPKLVLIGINQVGSDLIQLVPDIAKRVGIHRIKPGTKAEIDRLVTTGCTALNVLLNDPARVFEESKGDYWLAQQLCQVICTMNDVLETTPDPKPRLLSYSIPDLRKRVVERLQAGFYPAVKEFCRGRRFRPSNDPYFKLLRSIGGQDSSIVDLNALAARVPEVRGSINNIKEHRLRNLLDFKPICARHFYYNTETKNFAIEDPALFYFLKHMDWDALRIDSGFKDVEQDFEFDFAISFAGENRELAKYIATQLEVLDAHVFFDENFEANYLGKTWSKEFKRIFGEASRLVVCVLDKHHSEKIWPTFERECFQPRVADEEVVPIFLDDTKFVGIPQDIVGIKFKWNPSDPDRMNMVVDEIVFKLFERLN